MSRPVEAEVEQGADAVVGENTMIESVCQVEIDAWLAVD